MYGVFIGAQLVQVKFRVLDVTDGECSNNGFITLIRRMPTCYPLHVLNNAFHSENRGREAGVLRGIFEKLNKTISELEIIFKKCAL